MLDLRASSCSSTQGLVGNIGISSTTVIENAIGGSGADTFIGNAANNVMTGNGGNDIFYASGGTDTFDGGAGTDQLVLTGASSDYDITTNGSGNTVYTDLRSGSPDGVIELISVESVVFGGTVPDTATLPVGIEEVFDIGIVVEDYGHAGCACSMCKYIRGENDAASSLNFTWEYDDSPFAELSDGAV